MHDLPGTAVARVERPIVIVGQHAANFRPQPDLPLRQRLQLVGRDGDVRRRLFAFGLGNIVDGRLGRPLAVVFLPLRGVHRGLRNILLRWRLLHSSTPGNRNAIRSAGSSVAFDLLDFSDCIADRVLLRAEASSAIGARERLVAGASPARSCPSMSTATSSGVSHFPNGDGSSTVLARLALAGLALGWLGAGGVGFDTVGLRGGPTALQLDFGFAWDFGLELEAASYLALDLRPLDSRSIAIG